MVNDTYIDDLISKFLAGEATPEQAMDLEEWLRQPGENQRYFEQCRRIFATVVETPSIPGTNTDTLKAWKKIAGSISEQRAVPPAKAWQEGWLAAASVVLLIIIGLLINTATSSREIVYTAGNVPTNHTLKDGTVAALEPGSILTLDRNFDNDNRYLKFSGSATFTVRHDDDLPFIINIHPFYIKDLGTKFTIRSSVNRDTCEVRVFEGKVKLYDNLGWEAHLGVGEAASYIRSIKKPVLIETRVFNQDTMVKRRSTLSFDTIGPYFSKKLPDTLLKPVPDRIKHWIKPSLRPHNLPRKPVPENNGKKDH